MTIPAGTLVPRDARDFGSYELIAKLATGGMAEIFLARGIEANALPEKVVLKRILPHLAEDEHFVTMFRDEANLASRIIHPNVCRVHALGHHGATWFIVMEYLHGVALSRMLSRLAKRHAFIDFRIIGGLVYQACEGLHNAHELRDGHGHLLNVVHRDVSPPNIMLTDEGIVKLLDFGIAKARGANSKTRTGTVKGKNAYMSPEQILGKPLDRRSDVFALGAVMYELLAVKRLFHRESDFLTFKAITEEPIPDIRDRRADIPLPLRGALTQALARDPNGRFATAKAFGELVKDALAPLGGPATPAELKKYLHAEFNDELAARAELLRAADDPNAAPATSTKSTTSRMASLSMGPTHPQMRSPTSQPTEELEMIEGMVELVEDRRPDRQVERAPSMIVANPAIGPHAGTPMRGVPIQPPPPRNRRPPTQPPPIPGARPSGTVGTPMHDIGSAPTGPLPLLNNPTDIVGLDEGLSTDLLRGYRRKSLIRMVITITAVLSTIVIGVIVIAKAGGDDDPRPAAIADAAVASTPPVDARPPPETPPDADPMREDIIALSKWGFFSLDATAKTKIFIDDKYAGETPLTRYLVAPGVHKVKAIGPRGKIKKFTIKVYAAKDTDWPTIEW